MKGETGVSNSTVLKRAYCNRCIYGTKKQKRGKGGKKYTYCTKLKKFSGNFKVCEYYQRDYDSSHTTGGKVRRGKVMPDGTLVYIDD